MTSVTQPPLAGKRTVVTGASRGIGRAIALALAEAGADLALVARNEGDLTALAAEIAGRGRQAHIYSCDVTHPDQVADMAQQAEVALGGVDILVNNAGMAESHAFVDHPDDLWRRLINVNLNSVYYVTKAFAPGMVRQRSGRILNIASIAARVGSRYIAAYTASKHGVLGLTRALAVEFVPYNITVNAICPGYVDTPMTERSIATIAGRTGMSEAQAHDLLANTSPQKRLIAPEEVAAVAVFLALDSSKGITGQAINIDGGGVMS